MASRKIKDIPHLKPNQHGQMPFYCESRDDYEFLVKAIVHRREVEPTFAALDLQRDAQKNAFFLQAMKGTIAQPFQELEAVSKSQVEFFTTQNQALQNFLQSKPSPQHIPLFSPQQICQLTLIFLLQTLRLLLILPQNSVKFWKFLSILLCLFHLQMKIKK